MITRTLKIDGFIFELKNDDYFYKDENGIWSVCINNANIYKIPKSFMKLVNLKDLRKEESAHGTYYFIGDYKPQIKTGHKFHKVEEGSYITRNLEWIYYESKEHSFSFRKTSFKYFHLEFDKNGYCYLKP